MFENKTFIIGIGYKAKQGKDTLAGYLMQQLPDAKIIHLADALKEEAKQYGWMETDKNESATSILKRSFVKWEEEGWPPVEDDEVSFLQYYGTSVVRARNPYYWIEKVKERIIQIGCPQYVIIPDVRYFNELQFCRAHGITILIEGRPLCEERSNRHPSETQLDDFRWIFDCCFDNSDHGVDKVQIMAKAMAKVLIALREAESAITA